MTTQTSNVAGGIPVLDILPEARLIGANELGVDSCCGQWDECQQGDLYVAILDAEMDGHDFCPQAVAKGAKAVITERLVATSAPQVIVADSRQAYSRICHALAGSPSRRMQTVGVSGSVGKTVTAHLVEAILQADGQQPGRLSSISGSLGQNVPSITQLEFNPPMLADQLSQMVLNGCSHAVVEVSARDLAKRKFEGVGLDVAVLTNMRDDDIDFHSSRKNFKRSQLRILDALKPEGIAVLNLDDPISHFTVESCTKPVLTFGMHQDANVRGQLLDRLKSEQSFLLAIGTESVPVRTETIGDEHLYNCLCAATVGLALGIDIESIARGLELGSKLPGRLERVECGQDFGVWIDSAKTPIQLATALRTVKQVVKGKVWCLCSILPEQSNAHRSKIGEVIDRAADHAVLTHDAVDAFTDYEPMHQMLDGFEDPKSARLVPNRFRAIEWVLSQAKPQDAVLIAGCGEKPFALIGEENWTIRDRDVCEAWLYDNASIDLESESSEIYRIDDYR